MDRYKFVLVFEVCPGGQGLAYWLDYFKRQFTAATFRFAHAGLWKGQTEGTFALELWVNDLAETFAIIRYYQLKAEQEAIGLKVNGSAFVLYNEYDYRELLELLEVV